MLVDGRPDSWHSASTDANACQRLQSVAPSKDTQCYLKIHQTQTVRNRTMKRSSALVMGEAQARIQSDTRITARSILAGHRSAALRCACHHLVSAQVCKVRPGVHHSYVPRASKYEFESSAVMQAHHERHQPLGMYYRQPTSAIAMNNTMANFGTSWYSGLCMGFQ